MSKSQTGQSIEKSKKHQAKNFAQTQKHNRLKSADELLSNNWRLASWAATAQGGCFHLNLEGGEHGEEYRGDECAVGRRVRNYGWNKVVGVGGGGGGGLSGGRVGVKLEEEPTFTPWICLLKSSGKWHTRETSEPFGSQYMLEQNQSPQRLKALTIGRLRPSTGPEAWGYSDCWNEFRELRGTKVLNFTWNWS